MFKLQCSLQHVQDSCQLLVFYGLNLLKLLLVCFCAFLLSVR